jgi:hypothetical protein
MFLREGAMLSVAAVVVVQRTVAYLRNNGRPLTFEGLFADDVVPRLCASPLIRTIVTVTSLQGHYRCEVATIPVRWTVVDALGHPVPFLDANLEVSALTSTSTSLGIVASYSACPMEPSATTTRVATM